MRRKRKLDHLYRRLEKLFRVILVLCIVAVVIIVGNEMIQNHKMSLQKEKLANEINKTKKEETSKEELPELVIPIDEAISMLPEYQSLYNQNSDIVGWLKIDDTVIDYPVMQTMDN